MSTQNVYRTATYSYVVEIPDSVYKLLKRSVLKIAHELNKVLVLFTHQWF